jgi:hypothetical protein
VAICFFPGRTGNVAYTWPDLTLTNYQVSDLGNHLLWRLLAHVFTFQSAIYTRSYLRKKALEVLWYEKDMARFASSARQPVPRRTDGQRKRLEFQLQLTAEHNSVFYSEQQQHNSK